MLVLLLGIPLRQRPGFGTLSNVIVIGLVIDGVLAVVERRVGPDPTDPQTLHTALLSEPMVTVRSGRTARAAAGAGMGIPSRLSSAKVSSMTVRVPARRSARRDRRRAAASMSSPVGLWKSGIRYASAGT